MDFDDGPVDQGGAGVGEVWIGVGLGLDEDPEANEGDEADAREGSAFYNGRLNVQVWVYLQETDCKDSY